jgi:hypothetical protein
MCPDVMTRMSNCLLLCNPIIAGEHMCAVEVLLFKEDTGSTPFLEWYDRLHKRARYKYYA